MRARLLSFTALVAVAAAPAALAQPRPLETAPAKYSMAKEYRAVQQSALTTQRKLLIKFADSMPERLYRDRATPAQRAFAEQVAHIAVAGRMLGAMFAGVAAPAMPDTAAVYNSRDGLKKFINETYDGLDKLIAEQSDADRDGQVKFFGTFMPRWQVWDELNQHAMWTAGQIVANFRKHGMAPPSFMFF